MGMVIRTPGAYTTVQDEGRFGYEQYGVSPAGPMDKRAFHIANILVGNELGEAQLEMTIMGPEINFTSSAVVALTGSDMKPMLNGHQVSMYRALSVKEGDVLKLQVANNGCRTYLSVAGGLEIPEMMGSRSTLVKNNIGGYQGRPLKAGDLIEFRKIIAAIDNQAARFLPPECKLDKYSRVRVILGPQNDCFTEKGIKDFLGGVYKVSGEFDRMGYRLQGAKLQHVTDGNIISDGVVMGSIQVPSAGQPIVMMADCQSIGGYTKIATVINVDLPLIGQCRAGHEIQFVTVNIEEAQQLYMDYYKELDHLKRRLEIPVTYSQTRHFQINVQGVSFQVKVEEHE